MEKQHYVCSLCHHPFAHGATRCQACGGRIVYGATEDELAEAAQGGMTAGVVGTALMVGLIPEFANRVFGWNIPIGLGLGFWSLLFIPAVGAVWAGYARWRNTETLRDKIRVFDQP